MVSDADLTACGKAVEKAALEAYADERDDLEDKVAGTYRGPRITTKLDPNRYKEIVPRFELFHLPKPEAAVNSAENLATAWSGNGIGSPQLQSVKDLHSMIGDGGELWQGKAAAVFDDYYLSPFGAIVANQRNAVASLENCMNAYAEIIKRRREDAMEVGKQTIAALEASKHTDAVAEAQYALTLLGAAISIAGVPVTGGGSISLGVALVGSALSIATSAIGAASDPKINGPTVDAIIESSFAALELVDQAAEYRAKELAGRLRPHKTLAEESIAADKTWKNIPNLVPQEPNDDRIPNVTGGDGKKLGKNGGFRYG